MPDRSVAWWLVHREIENYCIRHGNFTLASGRKSRYYIDLRKLTLRGNLTRCCGELLWDLLHVPGQLIDNDRPRFTALGGPATAAIPLITSTIIAAAQKETFLDGCYVRSASKEHGTQARIEGYLYPGSRMVLLDDTVTTGGSLLEALTVLERAGHKVLAAACLLDRDQGACQRLEAVGVPFHAVYTAADFGLTEEDPCSTPAS